MGSMPPPVVPAVQQAFGLIDRQVLGAPAASISFAGLDTANKMFRLTSYILKDGTNAFALLRFNNDAGANYDKQHLFGDGAVVSAARLVATTSIPNVTPTINANEHGSFSAIIAKQQAADEALVVSEGVSVRVALESINIAGIWNNILALISRIDLISNGGNFDTGTVAILEGNQTT